MAVPIIGKSAIGDPLALSRLPGARRPDPRTPHPSWRETITGADQGSGRIINARDFWARLDI